MLKRTKKVYFGAISIVLVVLAVVFGLLYAFVMLQPNPDYELSAIIGSAMIIVAVNAVLMFIQATKAG